MEQINKYITPPSPPPQKKGCKHSNHIKNSNQIKKRKEQEQETTASVKQRTSRVGPRVVHKTAQQARCAAALAVAGKPTGRRGNARSAI